MTAYYKRDRGSGDVSYILVKILGVTVGTGYVCKKNLIEFSNGRQEEVDYDELFIAVDIKKLFLFENNNETKIN